MHYRNLFFSILFFLSLTNVGAQQRNYKTFTEDDGLPSSTIYSIFQDSKGYLWFATDHGVSRYDGYGFSNFMVSDGLSDNEVFDFFEDSRGRLWFCTLNGKVSYYWKNQFFNSQNDASLKKLDSNSMITGMFEDSLKNIWFSTYNDGIIRYKDGYFKRYFNKGKLNNTSAVFSLARDTIGVITKYGVRDIYVNNGDMGIISKGILPANNIAILNSKIAKSSNNSILFKDLGAVYEYDYDSGSIELVFGAEFSSTKINNLCKVDGDGIWICTSKGVVNYSELKSSSKGTGVEIKNYNVSSVLRDEDDNYWIGTLGSGVLFYSKKTTFHCSVENGLTEDNVAQLFKGANSKIWFSYNNNGAGYLDSKRNIKNIEFRENLLYDSRYGVNNILVDKENIWIASNSGVILLNGVEQDILGLTTKDLLIENDSLWLACSSGLYNISINSYHELKNKRGIDLNEYKIMDQRVNKVFGDREDNIWIAAQNELFLKPNGKRLLNNPIVNNIQINDIKEITSNTYLLATNGAGVGILKDSKLLKYVTTNDGLSSNICSSIVIDSDSTIWIATNNGLNKIMDFPFSTEIHHFNVFDGLGSNAINDMLLVNDTLWVATNKGLDFFRKNAFISNSKAPKVQIESIIINGSEEKKVQDLYELKYDQNDLIINYVGISLNGGGDIVYRYKLNTDSQWKHTRNRSINFSSLSPDNYNFRIAAKSKAGSWSQEKAVNFVILSPFYQTYWFMALVVLLVSLIIGLIVRQIIKNQHFKNAQKQRVITSELKSLKAQISPHFVFNALNSIQGELLKKEPEVALNYLGKLGRLMRKVLDHSEQLYVSVAEEISIITDYLDTEKFKTGNKFDYSIDVAQQMDFEKTLIPSMIIQPFVENSIWHGFTEPNQAYFLKITFDLNKENDLIVKVIDNGIGRDKAAEIIKKSHYSKGLEMVKERFEALNFGNNKAMSFLIEDIYNENNNSIGTSVTLTIPQS